ncbi:MAG: nuclear transport factor 2 family protein [Sphingomonadaceae bacterium]
MPSTDQMRAAVAGYVAGFEAGDVDALVGLFAENATVEDPVGGQVLQGTDAIREFYAFSISTGAKLAMLGEPRCAGDYVAFPFTVTLDWEGARQVIEVIDTFRIDDAGKITEMRAFWGPENMKPA